MKKTLLQIALLALAMCCNVSMMTAQKPFTLKGTVADGKKASKVNIYIANENNDFEKEPTAVVDAKKNKFTYKVTLQEIKRAFISIVYGEGEEASPLVQLLFAPGEKAELTIDGEDCNISGTTFYQQVQGYREVIHNIYAEYQTLYAKQKKITEETAEGSEERKAEMDKFILEAQAFMGSYHNKINNYIEQHNNEEGVIVDALTDTSVDVLEVYAKASDEVKNGRFGEYLKSEVNKAKELQEKRKAAEEAAKAKQAETGEGAMFVDFAAEYEGKVQKLSDYVGKGKYVLVDFWASWCGPCRGEIPNLIKVWETYKGENFEVLGVATWDKPEDTVKAIEELKIQYPQIMNAQKAGSDAYGIQGIPQIILFGPDGKIVARNLRGKAIEEKVKECLSSVAN